MPKNRTDISSHALEYQVTLPPAGAADDARSSAGSLVLAGASLLLAPPEYLGRGLPVVTQK